MVTVQIRPVSCGSLYYTGKEAGWGKSACPNDKDISAANLELN